MQESKANLKKEYCCKPNQICQIEEKQACEH